MGDTGDRSVYRVNVAIRKYKRIRSIRGPTGSVSPITPCGSSTPKTGPS